jgi:hypothetical protein
MLYWYNRFSWWWARGCSKHVENWNKHIEKRTVRQVGHLQELYWDAARSTEHKTLILCIYDTLYTILPSISRSPNQYCLLLSFPLKELQELAFSPINVTCQAPVINSDSIILTIFVEQYSYKSRISLQFSFLPKHSFLATFVQIYPLNTLFSNTVGVLPLLSETECFHKN